ncbi:hypothetical protein C8J57DRAFT_1242506 [Mycena rebaudengoi]|nr:hypothetical protein C8J57DRAFT_1242506 [Mycena rebaudengoi]
MRRASYIRIAGHPLRSLPSRSESQYGSAEDKGVPSILKQEFDACGEGDETSPAAITEEIYGEPKSDHKARCLRLLRATPRRSRTRVPTPHRNSDGVSLSQRATHGAWRRDTLVAIAMAAWEAHRPHSRAHHPLTYAEYDAAPRSRPAPCVKKGRYMRRVTIWSVARRGSSGMRAVHRRNEPSASKRVGRGRCAGEAPAEARRDLWGGAGAKTPGLRMAYRRAKHDALGHARSTSAHQKGASATTRPAYPPPAPATHARLLDKMRRRSVSCARGDGGGRSQECERVLLVRIGYIGGWTGGSAPSGEHAQERPNTRAGQHSGTESVAFVVVPTRGDQIESERRDGQPETAWWAAGKARLERRRPLEKQGRDR